MPIPNNLQRIRTDLESVRSSLEGGDLGVLESMRPALEALVDLPSVPSAMRTLARRLIAAVDDLAARKVDVAQARPKLSQGVAKLLKSMERLSEGASNPPEGTEVSAVDSNGPDTEELDLLRRFASRQEGELEDFEVAILEREKGSAQGDQFVKRHLHTLKGEFGVLDLG
jgi:hypothetical protein